jgi:magnesium-protoporphyrin O-methyltransferase
MSCRHCQGAGKVFSHRYVARELRRYRRRGPRRTTRLLIEAIRAEGVAGCTLLDVGGGVGAIQHELLKAGVARAASAEAAPAYLAAARAEAERQGHAERITYHEGDFVELAEHIVPADIVTLDRTICCYPDVGAMVALSAARAQRLYGVVYPRDAWWTRFGNAAMNFFLWVARNPFRTFVHPTRAVEEIIGGAGLTRRYYRQTPLWQVAVYAR